MSAEQEPSNKRARTVAETLSLEPAAQSAPAPAPAGLAEAVHSAFLNANRNELPKLLNFLLKRCDQQALEATRDEAIRLKLLRVDATSNYQTVKWNTLDSIMSMLCDEKELRKCQLVCRSWYAAQRWENVGWTELLSAYGQEASTRWLRELSQRRINVSKLQALSLQMDIRNQGVLNAIAAMPDLLELVVTCPINQDDMALLAPCVRLVSFRHLKVRRQGAVDDRPFNAKWFPNALRAKLKSIELEDVLPDSISLLLSFPQLVSLKLRPFTAGAMSRRPCRYVENLLFLQLNCPDAASDGTRADFVHSVFTIAQFPSLQVLSLGESANLPRDRERLDQVLSAVTSIRALSIQSARNLELVSSSKQWKSFTRLRAVDLGAQLLNERKLKAVCDALSAAPNLIALSANIPPAVNDAVGQDGKEDSQWRHLSAALSKLQKLQALQQRHGQGICKGFLHALPRQLKRLSVHSPEHPVSDEFTAEMAKLESKDLCPDLHSLQLWSANDKPIGGSVRRALLAKVHAWRSAVCVAFSPFEPNELFFELIGEECECGRLLINLWLRSDAI